MYASHGFLRSDIGDVDVLFHDGLFHLFHLVLPNHDFIAHAVSEDGMSWRRVRNALFVGEPSSWDDDMLWTMHVTGDPDRPGAWRMFYTGLSRREFGRVQRVGVARSEDLYTWTRCDGGSYPLEIDGTYYESRTDEGRQWVSFRDPFFYLDPDTGERLLLSSARIKTGPVIRRGCVGFAREVAPDRFVFEAPLHRPGIYDDVEVPNLFRIGQRHFLLGSIREDTKIHYWYSDTLRGPYENFVDNVILPSGNYAARVCWVGDRLLLFNFYARKEVLYGRETVTRLLPPPKEVSVDARGRLILRSYSWFDDLAHSRFDVHEAAAIDMILDNPHAKVRQTSAGLHLACQSGYEIFVLPGQHENFRLRARLRLDGLGKCGLVLRMTEDGDGYYVSLDLIKGYALLRQWAANQRSEFEHAFRFETIQTGSFVTSSETREWDVEVVTHGMYVELSINGQVTLSLVDDSFSKGRIGFYAESAELTLSEVTVEALQRLVDENETVYTATRPTDIPTPAAGP